MTLCWLHTRNLPSLHRRCPRPSRPAAILRRAVNLRRAVYLRPAVNLLPCRRKMRAHLRCSKCLQNASWTTSCPLSASTPSRLTTSVTSAAHHLLPHPLHPPRRRHPLRRRRLHLVHRHRHICRLHPSIPLHIRRRRIGHYRTRPLPRLRRAAGALLRSALLRSAPLRSVLLCPSATPEV